MARPDSPGSPEATGVEGNFAGPLDPLHTLAGETGLEVGAVAAISDDAADVADAPEPLDADERTRLHGTTQLVRSSSIVGAGTLVSRVSGLVRTIAIAAVLGAHTLADGYNLANTTPNMIYDLLLGGVFSATLVPIFVDHHVRHDDDGDAAVITVLVSGLVAVTALAMVLAPWIFRLYTWNITSTADRAEIVAIGVPMLRWFLPQILFYGLTALASAMLNARRSYVAPAFAPALNNIVVLCFLGAFWRVGGIAPSAERVLGDPTLMVLLGGGTTAGIVVMACALWPALRRAGIRLRPYFDLRHRSISQVFRLSGWTLAYTVANQIALAIVLALAASIASTGNVTAYTYAFMFFQLPNGLFAVSLMTTTEPEMARAVVAGDTAGLRRQFASGLRLVMLVLVPASAVMAVLAHPIVNVLLGHGGYRHDTELTGTLLLIFSLGLVGYSVYLYALRCFYAQKNTRTPFFVNVVENTINVALAFAFVGRWGAEGLVASFSIAYTIAAVLALLAVRRTTDGIEGPSVWNTTWRALVATAATAVAATAVVEAIGTPAGFGSLPALLAGGVVAAAVFALCAWQLRIPDVDHLVGRLGARFSHPK
ncbi:MAG: murein biosynthesis integral membrane protein MurJ [Actinobacteria bacterium]|nr:murein biosynthesis integral membrane protein MurJ [Actinomycetota bacterium]